MQDALQISTISFRSQAGRSHPWVRRLYRDLFGKSDQTMIIVCQSLGSRPILVLELFIPVPRLFGTTSRCLSVQPVQLLPSRNIWRHISLIWLFPHRYRHSPWPVDVTELFPRFCCWTLIWLSRHWAWLRRGYWHYRSLIDWLIDWYNDSQRCGDPSHNERKVCQSHLPWKIFLSQRFLLWGLAS